MKFGTKRIKEAVKTRQHSLRARQLIVGIGMALALALALRIQPMNMVKQDLTEQSSDWAYCSQGGSKALVQDAWDDIRF
jgi:aspartate oxidase